MRIITLRRFLIGLTLLFLLPLAAHAVIHSLEDHPENFRTANWGSVGMLPDAGADRDARLLIFSGRTGRWKGIFSVHSWVVYKPDGATTWSRYDVVGWGNPVRVNGWAPDGRWYGNPPTVLVDISGAEATALIPKIEQTVRDYQFANAGDYRIWPGPNSNTFVATVLRAVPELGVMLPPNAVGRDFRPRPYAGLSDSGTGIEASLWGLAGFKLGWIEGVEVNLLGLVAGVDLRQPALKLPGFGRIGLDGAVTTATASK